MSKTHHPLLANQIKDKTAVAILDSYKAGTLRNAQEIADALKYYKLSR